MRLSTDEALLLHAELIEETGGADGIRDEALLDSALEAPMARFGDQEAFPTVEAKAARLAFGLVDNHPFADGNKRIGDLAMLVTLHGNAVPVAASQDELIELGFGLAQRCMDTGDAESGSIGAPDDLGRTTRWTTVGNNKRSWAHVSNPPTAPHVSVSRPDVGRACQKDTLYPGPNSRKVGKRPCQSHLHPASVPRPAAPPPMTSTPVLPTSPRAAPAAPHSPTPSMT